MKNQILDLLKHFIDSLNFVVKKKLYFYFFPAIILAIIFYLSMKGGSSISHGLDFMKDWWGIGAIIRSIEGGIKAISLLTFEIVILVLLTPINSYFAEKVKEDIDGVPVEFDMAQFFGSLVRSVGIFLIAFVTEMVLLLVLWIFSFIIGDFIQTITAFVVSSFFIGFSFFDFGLELKKVSTQKSWKWARANKLLCLVAGLIFSISIYIPEESNLLILFLVSISIVPHMLTIATTRWLLTKED